jgi:hypothetical protein
MKKKILAIVLTAVLVLSLGLVFAAPVGAHTETNPDVCDLIAGQNTVVGEVQVWNDGDDLHVTYLITEPDWVFTGTHLYVGQNNPHDLTTAPGQFPYDDSDATVTPTMVEYVIPLGEICEYQMELNKKGNPTGKMVALGDPGVEPCNPVFIAAHAGVNMIEEGYTVIDCLVSGAGTDDVLYLLEGDPGYPVGYPGPYSGTPIPSVLAWVHSSWPAFPVAGAQWIDSSNPSANTDYNTWRLFTRSFSFPTNATNISGTLTMNCDNAEEVYLNNTLVGYDTNHPSTKIYGVPVPPSGPAHGWQTIESWDVSAILTAGTNDLWTMTRNYAWGGGPYANPTGLIYSLCYEYDIPDTVVATETAWGEGTDFEQPNWAMYFTYSVQPCPTCVDLRENPPYKDVPAAGEDVAGSVCFTADSENNELDVEISLDDGEADTRYGAYLELYDGTTGGSAHWLSWYRLGYFTTDGSGAYDYYASKPLSPGTYYYQVVLSKTGAWGLEAFGTDIVEIVID